MRLKYIPLALRLLPLLPLLRRDARRVLASVPRLPAARDPQGSVAGDEPRLRMLCIGESTMAGVGVETHREGIAHHLARTLVQGWGRGIDWQVHARSGYTLKMMTGEVLPAIPAEEWELIVVAMGANEVFKMNTPNGVRRDYTRFIEYLRNRFGPDVPIAFMNMPAIRDFPAFSPVLRSSLGAVMEHYGEELDDIVANFTNVYFNAEKIRLAEWAERLGMPRDPAPYFSDGVHPSALTYQIWGEDFGRFLLERLDLGAGHGE